MKEKLAFSGWMFTTELGHSAQVQPQQTRANMTWTS